MSDINEVRERLHAAAAQYAGPLNCSWLASDIRALLDDHARLQAVAEGLERFRALARWVSNSAGHGINSNQRRLGEELLVLIDGQKAAPRGPEHRSEAAANLVTDDAVRRLVRAMENTPGDDLIEPNTRLCRRLLVAAMQPTKSEED